MANYTIENEHLRIVITERGAELQSIFDKNKKREILWQGGQENYWVSRAPVLFPFCGGVKDKNYCHNGKTYNCGKHGFLREQNFTLKEQKKDCITLSFTSTNETFVKYPFTFVVEISFILKENSVEHLFSVHNTSNDAMFFNIGYHPGFNCPFDNKHTIADYEVEFEQNESLDQIIYEGGLLKGETKPFMRNSKTITLNQHMFDNDCIAFSGINSKTLTLKEKGTNRSISFDIADFEYVLLWTNSTDPIKFLCVEPWHGIDDSINTNGILKDKKSIQILNPDALYNTSLIMTFAN